MRTRRAPGVLDGPARPGAASRRVLAELQEGHRRRQTERRRAADAPARQPGASLRSSERVEEALHEQVARLRLGAQAAQEDLVQPCRHAPARGRRPEPAGEHLLPVLLDALAAERPLAVERLPERDAEAELVAARVDGPAAELLRRHVRRRPRGRAPSRLLGLLLALGLAFDLRLLLEDRGLRQPEVHDAHPPVAADEHVARLEVAVHEPGGMCGGEPAPGLEQDLHDLPPAARRLGQPLGERAALDELHGQEDLLAHRADVEHRQHVGVREPRHRLRLAQQPPLGLRRGLGAARQGPQHLQGHLAVELGVERRVDDAHPSGAQQLDHDVAAELAERAGRLGIAARQAVDGGRLLLAHGLRDQRAAVGAFVDVLLDGLGLVAAQQPATEVEEHALVGAGHRRTIFA